MVLPMPSLSHAMTHGTISKWHKAVGDEVHMYDILLEVSHSSLTIESAVHSSHIPAADMSIPGAPNGLQSCRALRLAMDMSVQEQACTYTAGTCTPCTCIALSSSAVSTCF
jgi:hypothetical protein